MTSEDRDVLRKLVNPKIGHFIQAFNERGEPWKYMIPGDISVLNLHDQWALSRLLDKVEALERELSELRAVREAAKGLRALGNGVGSGEKWFAAVDALDALLDPKPGEDDK